MDPTIISITRRLDEAWETYVACQRRANRTLKKEDGWRAGKAWARFMDLFVPENRRVTRD
jgi:hypothetical protein